MKAVITKSKQTDLSYREPIAIEQAPARRVGPRLEGPRKHWRRVKWPRGIGWGSEPC